MSEEFVDDVLEPRKKFLLMLEKEHLENTKAYFEELVQKAGVDENENKETCKKIYGLESEIKVLNKKQNASRGLAMFIIILLVIMMLAGGILIAMGALGEKQNGLFIALGIVAVVAAIALLVLTIIKSKQKAKMISKQIAEKSKQLEEYRQKAYGQMAALNNAYEWNTYNIIMNKTIPLIKMDRIFDMKKYNQLKDKFNWDDADKVNISTVLAQSGSILGNPFILTREHIQSEGSKTYTGSITITWMERVSNGKGGSTLVPRSQTLTASVTKPIPVYTYDTKLIYGCEAAPDLSFSRNPKKHGYDQKSLEKFFKQEEKTVDAWIKKHPNFTPLGNDEFEDFFGGLDRDNEVQYRLLFTPLAQLSMLDILKNANPYGDDFSFVKKKMINTIRSFHSQNIDYDGYPSVFYHFDLEVARENFINRNVTYFKGLFFDLAPLLSIPLYQQYPTNEYIFNRGEDADYARHLSEMEANRYDESYFKHQDSITENILKAEFNGQRDGAHSVYIHAHGFRGIEHVDYITKMGGDGRNHDVPVHWIEYVPVDRVTPFIVQPTDLNRQDYLKVASSEDYLQFLSKNVTNNAILCSRGLFSFIYNGGLYKPNDLKETIEKILGK